MTKRYPGGATGGERPAGAESRDVGAPRRSSPPAAPASTSRAQPDTQSGAGVELPRPARLPLHTPPPMVIAPQRLGLKLACIAARPAIVALVRESLGVTFPGAAFATLAPSRVGEDAEAVPDAQVVIVDAWPDADVALTMVSMLRERRWMGGVVLLHASDEADTMTDASLLRRAAELRIAAIVSPVEAPERLAAAVTEALPGASGDLVAAEAWMRLRRVQRLIAAGEIAAQLQHALANPLTALLAEAQLLEMEPLSPELHEAVGRIIAQCRRTIEVAKRLEV
jgi:signal transduction histidine kinase